MSQRIKGDITSDGKADIDVVVGPDSYRSLPSLISSSLHPEAENTRGCDTNLSFTETYSDVVPTRPLGDTSVDAYVSVMRGCNNMCSYCVVPFTRGRERSKKMLDVVDDVKRLVEQGVKEVTLLGQNVNSYHDRTGEGGMYSVSNSGFTNLYKLRGGEGLYFADLVAAISDIDPSVRVRFTSPHPKDFPPHLLQLVGERR